MGFWPTQLSTRLLESGQPVVEPVESCGGQIVMEVAAMPFVPNRYYRG